MIYSFNFLQYSFDFQGSLTPKPKRKKPVFKNCSKRFGLGRGHGVRFQLHRKHQVSVPESQDEGKKKL